jgi:anti-sigma factor RsiW
VSEACLGELLTALADGALDHDERDRAQAHVARCDACRAELEAQRALKARLGGLAEATPPPPEELLRALRGLVVPGADPLAAPPVPRGARSRLVGPRGARPVAPARRPSSAPRAATGPGRSMARRARRASTVGGTLVALGVGAALLLGGSAGSPASTPVDPGSDAFVVDFVSTTSGVPLADPASVTASLPGR